MLTERLTLITVTHNLQADMLEVKWLNDILKDGEVISSVPQRSTYDRGRKDQFISDVGADAAKYISMVGW